MMLVAEWTRGQVYSLLDKPADAIGPYRRALKGNLEQGQMGSRPLSAEDSQAASHAAATTRQRSRRPHAPEP